VPKRLFFLAKSELFKARFLCWLLPKTGQIPVDRGKGGSRALKDAAKVLRSKFGSIGIFPEGTRSKSGKPFEMEPHTGFLVLGKLSGAVMVPVKISGTWEAMPPGAGKPRRKDCRVVFGKPLEIDYDSLDLKDREALKEKAHWVMQRIDELDL
jgi:1-acyl-sn-glycerol-3-phosphate acyltransferase